MRAQFRGSPGHELRLEGGMPVVRVAERMGIVSRRAIFLGMRDNLLPCSCCGVDWVVVNSETGLMEGLIGRLELSP